MTRSKNMLIEAFEETGIHKDYILGPLYVAANSFSQTLTPNPDEWEKNVQEETIETLNKMNFDGKALVGIGSNVLLVAADMPNQEIKEKFINRVKEKIQTEISYKKQRDTFKAQTEKMINERKNILNVSEIFSNPAKYRIQKGRLGLS